MNAAPASSCSRRLRQIRLRSSCRHRHARQDIWSEESPLVVLGVLVGDLLRVVPGEDAGVVGLGSKPVVGVDYADACAGDELADLGGGCVSDSPDAGGIDSAVIKHHRS